MVKINGFHSDNEWSRKMHAKMRSQNRERKGWSFIDVIGEEEYEAIKGSLQCDWSGLLSWHEIEDREDRRELMDAVIEEVWVWKKRSLWQRIFRKAPKFGLGERLNNPKYTDRYGGQWPLLVRPNLITYMGYKIASITDFTAFPGGGSYVFVEPTPVFLKLTELIKEIIYM